MMKLTKEVELKFEKGMHIALCLDYPRIIQEIFPKLLFSNPFFGNSVKEKKSEKLLKASIKRVVSSLDKVIAGEKQCYRVPAWEATFCFKNGILTITDRDNIPHYHLVSEFLSLAKVSRIAEKGLHSIYFNLPLAIPSPGKTDDFPFVFTPPLPKVMEILSYGTASAVSDPADSLVHGCFHDFFQSEDAVFSVGIHSEYIESTGWHPHSQGKQWKSEMGEGIILKKGVSGELVVVCQHKDALCNPLHFTIRCTPLPKSLWTFEQQKENTDIMQMLVTLFKVHMR